MEIKGFQKVTLIDYPKKIACTIFLFGCNFRCGFCHNPELVLSSVKEEKNYSRKEIIDYLEKRKEYLDGVCITGGEPLLTLDKEFLSEIKSLGYKIKIDTNGSFPEKLKEFIGKNFVDFVAFDIKASRENYEKVVAVPVDFKKIEESIKIICEAQIDYEFRITIVEGIHDSREIEKIGEWLSGVAKKKIKRFCLQGFKNNGKFVDENFKNKKDTSKEFLLELKKIAENYFEEIEIRV